MKKMIFVFIITIFVFAASAAKAQRIEDLKTPFEEYVRSIINKIIHKKTEIHEVNDYFDKTFKKIKKETGKPLDILSANAFFFENDPSDLMSCVREKDLVRILISIPALEYKLNNQRIDKKDFENNIIIFFGHELAHYWINQCDVQKDYSVDELIDIEFKAWMMTIDDIIQPMERRGMKFKDSLLFHKEKLRENIAQDYRKDHLRILEDQNKKGGK